MKNLSQLLGTEYPIIMAPMFLVSNVDMIVQAAKSGIAGCIPAHNFRTVEQLRAGLEEIKSKTDKPFGVNLIVNKSNPNFKKQLEVCCDVGISFFITSLGSPEQVINQGHKKGIKVLCDVTNLEYAMKVEKLGADGVVAVNNRAGGHRGNLSEKDLLSDLQKHLSIPIISAGGVSTAEDVKRVLDLGVAGLSIGTVFIASDEAPVTTEYKQACVDYGEKDIVTTTKISGTPCTVINTPYVQKTGTRQNALERFLNKNRYFKKIFKMVTFFFGMKAAQKAAFSSTYKTVWCAGVSIENVNAIEPLDTIIKRLTSKLS